MTAHHPIFVQVRRSGGQSLLGKLLGSSTDLAGDVRRVRWLANWLDAKFEVAGIRFGVEGIVGLIPVVGDLLGALAGIYPIVVARRHRLGRGLELRMALNLLLEWAVGLVPFVGDAFDVFFKANLRNLRLLERAIEKRQARAPK